MKKTIISFSISILFILCISFTITHAQAGSAQARFQNLITATSEKQDEGFDVSFPTAKLKDVLIALNNDRVEDANNIMDQIQPLLDEMTTIQVNNSDTAFVNINVSLEGDLGIIIPHLAGNVVNKSLHDEEIFQRFMNEIGPGLIQMKLFFSNLNELRDNFCYLLTSGRWEETVRQINNAGGEVMLHIRQVPSRLTLVPEANRDEGDGKAPIKPESIEEWRTIIKEIVNNFNNSGDPATRLKYIQSIGEPNIGTNWYDPNDLMTTRPLNVVEFAQHFTNTVEAAKEADPNIIVGGPTLWLGKNDKAWWDEFLSYMSDNQIPLGLITVHIYDANFGIWDKGISITKEKLAQYGFQDLEINMTEWNTGAFIINLPDETTNSHFNASHAIKGFVKTIDQNLQHTYFQLHADGDANCFEPGPSAASSVISNLLLQRDNKILPNTNYNAFRLFSMLRGSRRLLFDSDDNRILGISGIKENEIMLLISYYENHKVNFDNLRYFPPDFEMTRKVHIEISDIPFSDYNFETYIIDSEHSNIHTLGEDGSELELVSTMRGSSNNISKNIELPLYGVYMFRIINNDITSMEGDDNLKNSFNLMQNYPNPFNPETTIEYSIPKRGKVLLTIFDVLGRKVKTLVDKEQNPGNHKVSWDSKDKAGNYVSSGTYFYRIEYENKFVATKKLILLK